ncbi:MAG TPA: nuclear transport factor 2 family protein [Bryobacteraceae bacterium]|nr:nuclear transport factor 2 family protein [Bryobacteraceae bacterium]
MRKSTVPAVFTLALVLGACGETPAPVDKAAVEKSVRGVEDNMAKAIAAKDAPAFASNYAPDAVLMTPGEPAMKGADAIRAGMAGMLADPALKLEFASDRVEIANSGDMAATRGNYSLTATDGVTKQPVHDKGSYVTVFRKQSDGAWKAVLDINASEIPPPAAKAPKSRVVKKRKKR